MIPDEEIFYLNLGKRIRNRRKLLGLTQKTVAERIGTTYQQVSKYESAANKVNAFTLLNLANALAASTTFLLNEGEGTETFEMVIGKKILNLTPHQRQLVIHIINNL